MSVVWDSSVRRHRVNVGQVGISRAKSPYLANTYLSEGRIDPLTNLLWRDITAAFLEKEIEDRVVASHLIGPMSTRDAIAWWYWTREGAPAFAGHPLVRLIRLAITRKWITLPKPKPRQEVHRKIYRICPHIRLDDEQKHFEWLSAGTRTCDRCGYPVPFEEGAGFCSLEGRMRVYQP